MKASTAPGLVDVVVVFVAQGQGHRLQVQPQPSRPPDLGDLVGAELSTARRPAPKQERGPLHRQRERTKAVLIDPPAPRALSNFFVNSYKYDLHTRW